MKRCCGFDTLNEQVLYKGRFYSIVLQATCLRLSEIMATGCYFSSVVN